MKRLVALLLFLCLSVALLPIDTALAEEPDHVTAFFLSFLMPGLGQWYAGSPGSAKLFIASEVAIWGGYLFTTRIKNSYGNDYISFAATHAGVSPVNHSAVYLAAIGGYDSSYDYNRLQEQKTSSPVYYEGPQAWEWDSYENRDHFKELRERELDFENYAKYCVAGAVLNHFLAGLNASKLVREQVPQSTGVSIHPGTEGLSAHYQWSF